MLHGMRKKLTILMFCIGLSGITAGACFAEDMAEQETAAAADGTETNATAQSGMDYEADYVSLYRNVNYGDGKVYVIGHKNPDSDAVCSAIGYAEVLRQLGVDCEARVSGDLNTETQFILSAFGVEVPAVLDNAAGKNMILTDHNMYSQAIDGMEKANVVGILDHHNIGDIQSAVPLIVRELPVGAAATAVFLTAVETKTELAPETAGILAGAILSDTMNLTAQTTTDLDRDALRILADLAGIEDTGALYLDMRDAKESYAGLTDEQILLSDYKEYDMSGVPVAIGCVDASGKEHFEEMRERMLKAMKAYYDGSRLVHLYLMLNDYEADRTELLYYGEGAADVAQDAFGLDEDGRVIFDYVAVRKKDMVPPLTNAYKEQENTVDAVDDAA